MTSAHDALVKRWRRIAALDRAESVLRWDQETQMPPGGTEPRARELSTLATLKHETLTAEETRRCIQEADQEAETEDERALVREARWRYERRARVPKALIESLANVTARAHSAWVHAKRSDDFATFAPYLEEILELRRDYANTINPDEDPYAVLFADHEPWLDWSQAQALLERLTNGLTPLIETAPDPKDTSLFEQPVPLHAQRSLLRDVLETIGYDFEHGRIDDAEHPFSTGHPYDARIATHLHEDDVLSGLTSTIHEAGHALYTQGLPRDAYETPLGQSRNLVVHESQSRLWENHVARSHPFWTWLIRRLPDHGIEPIDPRHAYHVANQVQPSLIRVDADEYTYHLHIKLRVEIEQALLHGDLAVEDAPPRWNDRMEDLLGLSPPTDREGILQDVHWSHGSIGYFPTYSLGSMLAAQLYDTLHQASSDLENQVEEGEFGTILAWLRDAIHRHGRRYKTQDLIRNATGSRLSPEAFLTHANHRIGDLAEHA